MHAADHLVDFGPGPASKGASGRRGTADTSSRGQSLTASTSRAGGSIPPGAARATAPAAGRGARQHNLQGSTSRPARLFVCVTGVSGSGKSSLVGDILRRSPPDLNRAASPARTTGSTASTTSTRSSTSTSRRSAGPRVEPGDVHQDFRPDKRPVLPRGPTQSAGLPGGQLRFNVRGGRCEACQGHGSRRVALDLLPTLGRLPGLRGPAVQPRHAGGPVQGEIHRRRPRHVDRGGLEFFANVPRSCGRFRPCTTSGSTTCGSASPRPRCRAARPSVSSSRPSSRRAHRPDALHPRRADDGPAHVRRREAPPGAPAAVDAGNTVSSSSTTSSREAGRLGARPRAGGRGRRAARSSPRAPRSRSPRPTAATPARRSAGSCRCTSPEREAERALAG